MAFKAPSHPTFQVKPFQDSTGSAEERQESRRFVEMLILQHLPWPRHISCDFGSSPRSPIQAELHPLGNQDGALQCECWKRRRDPPKKGKSSFERGVGIKPGWDRPAGGHFQRLLLARGCSGSQWLWEREGSEFREERLNAASTTGSFLLPSPRCLFLQVLIRWDCFL